MGRSAWRCIRRCRPFARQSRSEDPGHSFRRSFGPRRNHAVQRLCLFSRRFGRIGDFADLVGWRIPAVGHVVLGREGWPHARFLCPALDQYRPYAYRRNDNIELHDLYGTGRLPNRSFPWPFGRRGGPLGNGVRASTGRGTLSHVLRSNHQSRFRPMFGHRRCHGNGRHRYRPMGM